LEVRWDLDDVGAEDLGDLESEFEFLDFLLLLGAVDLALVMHERLEADDL
jgi:hypothetical protein